MTALSIPERAREIARKWKLPLASPYLEALTEAMHSERELCAKELDDYAKRNGGYVAEQAAKLLREGGQK